MFSFSNYKYDLLTYFLTLVQQSALDIIKEKTFVSFELKLHDTLKVFYQRERLSEWYLVTVVAYENSSTREMKTEPCPG